MQTWTFRRPWVYDRYRRRRRRPLRIGVPAGPLVAGTAALVSVNLTATDATGGTPPYTYQWQRSVDGGSYSDLSGGGGIIGVDDLELTDNSVSPVHTYSYRLRYTDAVASQATSGAIQVGKTASGGTVAPFGSGFIAVGRSGPMNGFKPGQALYEEFNTRDSSGAATNADSTPTAALVRNGSVDGSVTLTVTNVATGAYQVTGTIPSGYAAGDCLKIRITATVGGVTDKDTIHLGVLDSKRNGDFVDSNNRVDIGKWLGSAAATPTVAGVPEVDVTYIAGLLASTAAGPIDANVTQVAGEDIITPAVDGALPVDIHYVAGQQASASNETLNVNVVTWNTTAVPDLPANLELLSIDGSGRVTAASVAGAVGSVTGAVGSVTAAVTVGSNTDKTGYVLSASGLDAISVADPGAPANHTTFPKMLVALWRRFFKKTTLTATELKTYADNGSTVNSTQAVSNDSFTETVGHAS